MPEAKPGIVHDGNYLVYFVDAIADISAPTVTEIEAGIALECQLTPDGLSREASDESVDNSRLCSTFSTMQVGRTSFEVSLTLVRVDTSDGSATDEAFTQLTKGKRGFLVVRSDQTADNPFASGDPVEVYPVQCGSISFSTPAPNELQTFTLPLMVTSDPDQRSTVAASV